MTNNNEHAIVKLIVERAEEMELLAFDRLHLFMDLDLASEKFELRFEELLNADDVNFTHDIVGIQKNINRTKMTFKKSFVPRYAV